MDSEIRDEVLYGRDHDNVRIFISSKMDGSLDGERKAAAEAVGTVTGHKPWWWEEDAPIGVLHSEDECVKFAFHSDGLVLLVAGELSDIIRAEYGAAKRSGGERYLLIREPDELPDDVVEFIRAERSKIIYRTFRNIDELKSHIYQGLTRTQVRALREMQLMRRTTSGGGDV